MPYHSPEAKAELAVKRYLETAAGLELGGMQILTRFEAALIEAPCLQVFCERAEPDLIGKQVSTGNWICHVTLRLYSHLSETAVEAHDALFAEVCDLLSVQNEDGLDGLARNLADVMQDEEVTIFDATLGERAHRVEKEQFVSEQALSIWLAPAKL